MPYNPGGGVFPPTISKTDRTAAVILAKVNQGNWINVTANSFVQPYAVPALLGASWYVYYSNNGNGDVTHTPGGAVLIDGLASFVMYPGEERLIQCDGVNFFSMVLKPFYRRCLTTFNFIWPPGYSAIAVDLVGAGGGGGSGRRGGAPANGGAPGGAPARILRTLTVVAPGTSTTVTIGAAGTGGVAQVAANTNGNPGTAGGNTSFGTQAIAYGGAAGVGGGTATGIATFTSGSGAQGAGASNTTGSTPIAGGPKNANFYGGTGSGGNRAQDNIGEGGGGCSSTADETGGCTEYGGAGTGAPATNGVTNTAVSGSSLYGVGAASQGAFVSNAGTLPATAPDAGRTGFYVPGGGAVGGTCGAVPTAGAPGAPNAGTDIDMGNPGAGGGSTVSAVAAAAGGAGSFPGGPGGGGGAASAAGTASGPGAAGADGRALITGIA